MKTRKISKSVIKHMKTASGAINKALDVLSNLPAMPYAKDERKFDGIYSRLDTAYENLCDFITDLKIANDNQH